MNMAIHINGMGVVGGFGTGAGDLIACLEKGHASPIVQDTDFGPAILADTSRLEAFVPKRSLRRIDHISQMALLGTYLALEDAGMPPLTEKRTGLIVCSGYGASRTTFSFLDSVINDGDALASPTFFSNSVHNSVAGHISILLKLEGPCLTVSQFEMSVPSALMSACQWLNEGRVDQVIFGAVDEYCDVVGYCWRKFFGEKADKTMTPLSRDRQSAIPAEGAISFLLSRDRSDYSRYGTLVDVRMGITKENKIGLSGDALYLIGADGHKGSDRLYADVLPKGVSAACYSPVYGSLPVGQAFDMAIAALSIREGRIFASPGSVADQDAYNIIRHPSPMVSGGMTCIKLTKDDEFGLIALKPG